MGAESERAIDDNSVAVADKEIERFVMVKYFIILMLIINCEVIFSQNLVPNPSFENYKELPCRINEFFIQDVLENWIQPITASTDYLRTDIDLDCDLNPNRINRQTRTGKAMTGIITAQIFKDFRDEYKEYLEVKLDQSIIPNKLYCGEFYAFNRNVFKDRVDPTVDILESNNLSLAFTDSLIFYPVSSNPPNGLVYASWAKITGSRIIPTDNQWHRIEGCFVADKNYEYLLIGNFHSIDSTKIVRKTFGNDFALAYYFIDDVSLYELPYDPPNLANSVTFCHNEDSIILDATSEGATTYTWQDGSTGPQFTVTQKQTDSYSVTISYGDFTYKDTFHVQYVPNIDLGTDTLLCQGETITLKANHPLKEYLWFDQSIDSINVISSAGIYWVEVAGECLVSDTIEVRYIDCPGFVPNIFTPNGDEFNPVFAIENIENRNWSLQVFNRWGQRVYESESYENDWDGSGLPSGVFYYLLYSASLNKRVKGWVQVVRDQ